MNIAIIGAGAAGMFTAINLKEINPSLQVTLYESASRPMAKLSITGGGRCNLTNSFIGINNLSEAYPRGDKLLKRAFHVFDNKDTCKWFEKHGIRLLTQEDQCVFPCSQDAGEIVNMLLHRAHELGILIKTNHKVSSIIKSPSAELKSGDDINCPKCCRTHVDNYTISFNTSLPPAIADAIVITTGGAPKRNKLDFLNSLELNIIDPVPALFSFNIPDERALTALMGTVVNNTSIGIVGSKIKAEGTLLITHWGISGPAALKLSSHAARLLAENNYHTRIYINWCNSMNEEEIHTMLQQIIQHHPLKQIANIHPQPLPSRLWTYLLQRAGIRGDGKWSELGKKNINRIVNILTHDVYEIKGKNRFKEEFVTCGGIALSNINYDTLESKKYPGIYFAGEVLDIDAITGGFNLQAAWTTGYIVAKALTESSSKF